MKTRMLRTDTFSPLLLPLLGQLAMGGQAYDYKIIAMQGQSIGGWTLSSIANNPTINDNSHIAFVASVPYGGVALLRWNGTQNEVLSVAFNGTYGSAAIDDSDRVATCYSATIGGNSYSAIRRYSGLDSYLTLNEAGNAQDPQVPGTFIWPYGSFMLRVFHATGSDQFHWHCRLRGSEPRRLDLRRGKQ